MTKTNEEANVRDLELQVLRAVKQAQCHRDHSAEAAARALTHGSDDGSERTRFERISSRHAELAQVALMAAIKLAVDLPTYSDMAGLW
jgi:hypothetical protein